MGKNPLQVLKGGLSKLKETVKEWKESLLSRLQKQQAISSEDVSWALAVKYVCRSCEK
jgi:hypothetical protein